MNKKKFAIIFTFLFAFAVLICVGTRIILEKTHYAYQEVQVRVISGEQTYGKISHTELIVDYKGKQYKLNGVTELYTYSVGQQLTACMADGKLYVDANAVKGGSSLFMVSYAFGMGSIVLLVPMLTFWIEYNKQKKNAVKQER